MMWFPVALRAYDAAVSAFTWSVLAPWSKLAVARGRERSEDRAARLGRGMDSSRAPAGASPLVVHAVSLGELQAARALVVALAARAPDLPVVISCGTSDALAVARSSRASHPNVCDVTPMPWDRRVAIRSWLARWRPRAIVLVEAELWPALITESAKVGVPVCVASGRLTEGDARRYAWARPFFARVFDDVRLVAVQDDRQRARFATIGAPADRVAVMGDLKVDTPAAPRLPWLENEAACLVVAGSVRADEEALVVDAWRRVSRAHPTARLVAAPRHSRRAPALCAALRDIGAPIALDAAARLGLDAGGIAVVDRPGLLASLCASADVVIVGGSFGRTGAHSLYEPARGGAAILVGPSVGAMDEVVASLRAEDGLVGVPTASVDDLAPALAALLSDANERQRRGARARAWLDGRTGVAARTAEAILDVIG